MPDISSIGHGPVGPLDRTSAAHAREDSPAPTRPGPPPARPGDRVELSEHARYLDQINRLPGVRSDRVEEVRQAIANGTYESEDKLDIAINRLIGDVLEE
jgi:negative regulator of flagellin synthesis FlgM